MTTDLDRYLDHVYGDAGFFYSFCTLDRVNGDRWTEGNSPPTAPAAALIAHKIERAGEDGLDSYLCAHLYLDRTRAAPKPNTAPITCLWVKRDAATIPPDVPPPTMTIETSPAGTTTTGACRAPCRPPSRRI